MQIPNTIPFPKLGSIVTFAQHTTNHEMPYRIRADLTWDDLLQGYYTDSITKLPTLSGMLVVLIIIYLCILILLFSLSVFHNYNELAPTSYALSQLEARRRHPIGYWTENSNKNMRMFFDDFAKNHNMTLLYPTVGNLSGWKISKKR